MPHCLIVEAGIATGPPKVLFLGKTLDAVIDQFSGYKPTPFSCSDNAYNGRFRWPARFWVVSASRTNGL